jgi:hypothetical protein
VIEKRIVRGAVAMSAVLIPLAGMTAVAVNPAAAAASGIHCTKLSGTANTSSGVTNTKLSSCNGKTGGSGTSKTKLSTSRMAPFHSDQPTSATFKWKNGKSTTIGSIVTAPGTDCAATDSAGFALVADESESGSVTADNTGSTGVGAATSAEVCAYGTANPDVLKLSNPPAVPFVIAP